MLSVSAMEAETNVPERLEELLREAAAQAAAGGVDLERFMSAAWTAYLASKPGLREHLEHMQTLAQLAELRRLGRVAEA